MVVCTGCMETFPNLGSGVRCNKCLARKPGLSQVELSSLNLRPQCCGCGIMGRDLAGLCRGCVIFYQSAETIPRDFMQNTRIIAQLNTNTPATTSQDPVESFSSSAKSVLDDALEHQERASESRIGLKVNTEGEGSSRRDSREPVGLAKYRQIQKSNKSKSGSAGGMKLSLSTDRKIKKGEWAQQSSTTGPKFSITLWKTQGAEAKPKQINQIQFSRVFELSAPMRVVIVELFERLNAEFKKLFDVLYDLLESDIKFFAHESATVSASIEYLRDPELLHKATAETWQNEFLKQRLCSKAALAAGILNIRFVVDSSLVPDIEVDLAESSGKPSTTLASKRKRLDSNITSILASKRPGASTSTNSRSQARKIMSEIDTPLEFALPGLPASVTHPARNSLQPSMPLGSARGRVLTSAFRAKWSREVKVGNYTFTRSTAQYLEDGQVNIIVSETPEVIVLAEDWVEGEKLFEHNDPEHYKSGFIGRGGTKRAIYARYKNQEYVITQPSDEWMTGSDVRDVLLAELKLLAQCDGIKKKFDEYVREDPDIGVIPDFYFNFKDSFYGKIEPLSASGRRTIPHLEFLATPLLPCGRFDNQVKKFTGSDDLGPAKDSMTQTVHAFVHFAWIYSKGEILFCDLQGTRDRNGRMCLIDPQAHTRNGGTKSSVYWDHGEAKIAVWKRQHLGDTESESEEFGDQRSHHDASSLCEHNNICSRLQLRNIRMEDLDESFQQPSSPQKSTARKSDIASLVHAQNVSPQLS